MLERRTIKSKLNYNIEPAVMKTADDAPLTLEVTATAGRKKTFCQKEQVEPEAGFGSRN